MFLRQAVLLVCLGTVPIATAATIVEDSAYELGPSIFDPDNPNEYSLSSFFTLPPDRWFHQTVFRVERTQTPGVAELMFVASDLGIGSEWFEGEFGQVFSLVSIANGTHELWGCNTGQWGPMDFGLTIDASFDEDVWIASHLINIDLGENPSRDIFGWVQLRVDSDLNVMMIDNAMAFDAGQIIIGKNLVPEPSGAILALLGLALLQRRRA
jgi:hypothetical protein